MFTKLCSSVLFPETTHPLLASGIERLAQKMRSAKDVVIFTGAGISTFSGIPDYRSPNGVWTQRDLLKRHAVPKEIIDALVDRGRSYVGRLRPTPVHMVISSLVSSGKVGMVVTQNLDGLHEESGVPVDQQAQLHGNVFKECCPKCKAEYVRKEPVKSRSTNVHDHRTGAKCDRQISGKRCKGELEAFVVNFGDDLPEAEMSRAVNACTRADLVIVIGSSMTVTPACDVPLITIGKSVPDDFVDGASTRVLPKGQLVIINSQAIEYDRDASLVIREDCQQVMIQLAKILGCDVPDYTGTKPGVDQAFLTQCCDASIAKTISLISSKPLFIAKKLKAQLVKVLKEIASTDTAFDTNPFSLRYKLERVLAGIRI